jgi:hypothetical protein
VNTFIGSSTPISFDGGLTTYNMDSYDPNTNKLTLNTILITTPAVGTDLSARMATGFLNIDQPKTIKSIVVSNSSSTIPNQYSITQSGSVLVLLPQTTTGGNYTVVTSAGDTVIINGENIVFREIGTDPTYGDYITSLQRGVGKTVSNQFIPDNSLVQSVLPADVVQSYNTVWYNYTGLPLQLSTSPVAQLLQIGSN